MYHFDSVYATPCYNLLNPTLNNTIIINILLYSDMDEWSYALLSCKVVIKCFEAGTVIYSKGQTSDFAYVLMGGSVKVSSE